MSTGATLDDFKASILTRLKGVEEKKKQAEKTRSDYIKLRDNINARINEVDTEISDFQAQIESGLKAIRDLERIVKDEEKLQQISSSTNAARPEPIVERLEPVVKKVEPKKQTEKNVTPEIETEPKQLQTSVKETTTKSDKTTNKKAVKEENNPDEQEKEEDPFMSEDGLPIMEIYEELDDDGNIISSHARPQRSQQLVDFANGPLAEILKKEEKIVADKKKTAEEATKPKPYGPEKPDWMVQKKPNPYDPPSLQPKTIKKLAKSDSTAATDTHTTADVQSNEKPATESITKQDSNEVKRVPAKVEPLVEPKALKSKPTLEKSAIETSEHEDNMTVELLKSEEEQFEKITPVPKEELVELQIIAGDEDSESDFEAGEDWEFNEEDYDDEESEDEFGRTRGSLFPFSIPHTIQKSIEEKRNKSTASLALETSIKHDNDKEPAIIKKEMEELEIGKSTVSSSSKRQVRFAETVNVKTFEKDPREVHGNIHGNVQNLFEIAREQMEQNGGQPIGTTFEQQLENLLYPDGVPQDEESEYKKITTTVVDEEIRNVHKVSRFKAARLNSKRQEEQQQQQSDDTKASASIKVSPVNTNIVERDFISFYTNELSKNKLSTVKTPSLSGVSASSQASASRPSSNLSSPNKVSASNPREEKKSSPTTDNSNTSKQSIFKRLNSNKNRNRFPTSSRIEEVKREEVPTVSPAVGDVSKFTIPLKSAGNNNNSINNVSTSNSSTRQGINTIKPGLAQGMGSLLSAEVLAKAEDYYQQSLLSEEDFIKAHSVENDEEENKDDDNDGKNQQDYQNRPIVEENLIEREFAPSVDSRGMGYVPAKYLQGDENESDEEDFTVSRAEIAKEYQKIRQSLIYQTGGYGKSIEELELEPVDEDGNAKKVSRFKAARLSTRRTPKF